MRRIKKIRFQIGDKILPEIDVEEMIKAEEKEWKHMKKVYEQIHKNPKNTKVCGTCEYYTSKLIYDYGSSGKCRFPPYWRRFDETCKRWKWDGIGGE
ncbi:MAG: hypothetical protein AB1420_15890 [Bacillota bacterium]